MKSRVYLIALLGAVCAGATPADEAAIRAGEALLANPPVIPDGPGDWIFYYANPKTGGPLVAIDADHHRDPKTGEVFTDAKIVGGYRCALHYAAERAAEQLGQAYRASGDDRFARGAQRILLKLADDYRSYPKRRDRWGRTGWLAPLGGRRYAQSLDEAVGVIRLAHAYDLTRHSPVWSDGQKSHVERELFRATADTLLWFNQGRSNHQTWYNAGLMAIAAVLDDRELAGKVVTMRGGFDDQLARSVGDDGLWYEGAMAYHFYALQAMRQIVDAGRRLGLDLHDRPRLRLMFDGPLRACYPNGQFPAINDSDRSFLANHRDNYQWATEIYGQERYRDPIAAIATESLDLSAAGLAILRRGAGDSALCAMIDYGPHGGGHGHPDKLQLLFYAGGASGGREWLLDPGRLSYSHPEHLTWCKTTVAHNTVVIDQRNQRPHTGKPLWLTTDADFAACAAESGAAYPGVMLRRYLLLTDRLLIDLFDVAANRDATIDWVAHVAPPATVMTDDRMNPDTARPIDPGQDSGYQHLQNPLQHPELTEKATLRYQSGQKVFRLYAHEPATFVTAAGIGHTIDQKTATLIRRVRARGARFLTIYDPGESFVRCQWDGSDQPIVVVTNDSTYRVAFTPERVVFSKE